MNNSYGTEKGRKGGEKGQTKGGTQKKGNTGKKKTIRNVHKKKV